MASLSQMKQEACRASLALPPRSFPPHLLLLLLNCLLPLVLPPFTLSLSFYTFRFPLLPSKSFSPQHLRLSLSASERFPTLWTHSKPLPMLSCPPFLQATMARLSASLKSTFQGSYVPGEMKLTSMEDMELAQQCNLLGSLSTI